MSQVVQLLANGDLRLSENQKCWPAQSAMEAQLIAAIEAQGFVGKRVHGYDAKHVTPLKKVAVPGKLKKLADALAAELQCDKAIMGVFDEGCMGMHNAIIPDELLNPTGVYKERLSQSALYYESTQVSDAEAKAKAVLDWYKKKGLTFHFGKDEVTELTEARVMAQCKMYIAAVRIADDFVCATIGIQYQQGLKDLLPASDLVEGTLNNADRPPVKSRDGKRVLYANEAIPHFNEVDECGPRRAAHVPRPQGAGPTGREHAARPALGR